MMNNGNMSVSHQFGVALRLCLTTLCVTGLLAPNGAGGDTIEGFAEPFQKLELSTTSEPGLLTAVDVKEGDHVAAGQRLATLDTTVLEASLAIAQLRAGMRGRIVAAEADLRIRRRQLGKLRTLRERGHATQAEIDRAEMDLAVSEAGLVRAQEEQTLSKLEVRRIEAEIQQRYVRSPIDGVVIEVHKHTGEATQISDPRVVTLVQLDPLRVKFSMSVQSAVNLAVGDVLPVKVADLGGGADVRVETVSPVLDASSGTVKVTCVLDNAAGELRSGMRCLLSVPSSSSSGNDLTVPVSKQRKSRKAPPKH